MKAIIKECTPKQVLLEKSMDIPRERDTLGQECYGRPILFVSERKIQRRAVERILVRVLMQHGVKLG